MQPPIFIIILSCFDTTHSWYFHQLLWRNTTFHWHNNQQRNQNTRNTHSRRKRQVVARSQFGFFPGNKSALFSDKILLSRIRDDRLNKRWVGWISDKLSLISILCISLLCFSFLLDYFHSTWYFNLQLIILYISNT